jgi:hypothetical protein
MNLKVASKKSVSLQLCVSPALAKIYLNFSYIRLPKLKISSSRHKLPEKLNFLGLADSSRVMTLEQVQEFQLMPRGSSCWTSNELNQKQVSIGC